jgi:outer membrane protein assembly factor BamB
MSVIARVRVLGLLLLAGVGAASCSESAPSEAPVAADAPLGTAGLRPSPQRPFGWRGDGTGRYPGATPPLDWSAKKNVRWSVVVGRGYASPILTDRYVFVTSEPDVLVCVDRATGRQRWKIQVQPAALAGSKVRGPVEAYEAPKGGAGLAAATPVTDGASVYVVLANGLVQAVDLEGKPRWTAGIDAEQSTGHGRSASPLLFAGKLIVHMTHLYAFDPATGRQAWVNTHAESTYGTPVGLRLGAVDLVVTAAGDVVRADDGKSVATRIGHTVYGSPIALDGVVYFGDRTVSAVKLDAAFKDEELWSGEVDGDIFGSPVWHGGLLYVVTAQAELFAYDAQGKGAQTPLLERRPLGGTGAAGAGVSAEAGGGGAEGGGGTPLAYASLTMAGQHLFLTTTKGDIVVLEATRQAKQVSRITMPEGSGATPVFSGREVILRAGDRLYCIRE